jgi:hypothetical protein
MKKYTMTQADEWARKKPPKAHYVQVIRMRREIPGAYSTTMLCVKVTWREGGNWFKKPETKHAEYWLPYEDGK